MISARFGLQVARSLSDSPAVSQLLATSPQTVTTPISYQLVNLRPFSQPLYVEIEATIQQRLTH